MRRNPWLFSACAVAALAACVTPRKDLGEINVKAEPPILKAQLITEYGFHIEEGRIFETRPYIGGGMDFAVTSEECIRGSLGHFREVCRLPAQPGDQPGVERWRVTASRRTFTTSVAADGSSIEVVAGLDRGRFTLGEGPAAADLRRHPVLLGVAFAYGILPVAGGTVEEDGRAFRFAVTQAR